MFQSNFEGFNDQNNNSDKIAVVLGASSGLGSEIVKLLLLKGFVVYGGSRRECTIDNDNFIESYVDVTSEDSVENFCSLILESYENVDLIINCVGVCELDSIENTTCEDFLHHLKVNSLGSFIALKNLKSLLKENSSQIIHLNSLSAKYGYPNSVSYVASKHALDGIIKCFKKEWESLKIKFTNLYVGAIDTPMWDQYENEFEREHMLTTEDFAYMMEMIIDAPRSIKIEEITFLHKDGFLE